MNNTCDVWVVIPAYREENILPQVLSELTQYPFNILVVDDGSPDETMQAALQFPVTVLRHVINLGQGAALQTGISYTLKFPQTRYIVTFDADGQHQTNDIQPMIDACRDGSYDVVLGSRFLRLSKAENIGFLKRFILKLAVLYTRLTTGLAITDTHNGLRVFTAEAAAKLNLTHNRMAHASEILEQIASHKMRVYEYPVTITYTSYSKRKGQSIFNGINILWELWMERIR